MLKRVLSIAAILGVVAAISVPFISTASSTPATTLGCPHVGPFPSCK